MIYSSLPTSIVHRRRGKEARRYALRVMSTFQFTLKDAGIVHLLSR